MIGSATSVSATKVLLLGSGELGKEVAIECQRLGYYVIACDSYAHAPAMQVAHQAEVLDMLDGNAIRTLVEKEQPAYIVPEVEAIATDTLVDLESEGFTVVPKANATKLTMNREGIRRLAAEELKLPTSPYQFADTVESFYAAVADVGVPCVVKPVMSSSGKGQSVIKSVDDIDAAWQYAQGGGRAGAGRVIVEGFIDFDYEITLLTVSACDGIHFCAPIGHRQEDGDYRESWQPQQMSSAAKAESERVAGAIVSALGGYGLFGVELFIKGDKVIFNEVSPRPHDTGLVTLASQELSEFALHVRAFSGFPIGDIVQYGPSASAVILGQGTSENLRYNGLENALAVPSTQLRLFGKPNINGRRRLGVAISRAKGIEQAVDAAKLAASRVEIEY
ncbi:formate-dependent phosphoribosylglycinamide formyltransferase [Vibrio ulleungensis]|uniref:Formate-dependent phosphoribosylglycinamide formyltransferase n=1 Tax=Vibrio ulleungensis TaxID=2807619 RepID=A0ABS2HE35_9VIBR|nr:formate-dependent phosphoribosylglycinamide formyltransferase [Vibrio ulleungensis]MBM7035850.1 formate-dependent phosphoribosylglycinamide formyltransferase [Vibrio ulleungensis]